RRAGTAFDAAIRRRRSTQPRLRSALMKTQLLGVCFLLLAVLIVGCGGGSEEDKIAAEIDSYKKDMQAAASKSDLKGAMAIAFERAPKIAESINKSSLSPEKKKALLARLEAK